MQDWEGSSNPNEVVRRSARKRRPPGDWWQDFPAEKGESLQQTSSEEADARKEKRKLEDLSTLQDSASSSSGENCLGEGYIVNREDEGGCEADRNEPLHQVDSSQEVTDSYESDELGRQSVGKESLCRDESLQEVTESDESDELGCQTVGKEPLCRGESTQEVIESDESDELGCHNVVKESLDQSTQEVIELDEDDEARCQAVGKEHLYQGESTQEVSALDTEVVPTSSLLAAEEDPVSGKSLDLKSDKSKKVHSDNESAGDLHEEPTPDKTAHNSGHTSQARRQGRATSDFPAAVSSQSVSWDTAIPASWSRTGHKVDVSDESTQQKTCESYPKVSRMVSGKSSAPAQHMGDRQGGTDPYNGRASHKRDDSNSDTTREKREGTPKLSDSAKKRFQGTSCNPPEASESLERRRSENRFSRTPSHESSGNLRVHSQHRTPPRTRNVTPSGVVPGPGTRTGELSQVRAPRKSRFMPNSPGYSFNLRSHPGPKSFPWSVIHASENQRNIMGESSAKSTCSRFGVLLAKGAALKHNLVTGQAGAVKVAISISLNQSTVGEIVILPRSTTGPRRALTGDEFYIVKRGYAECEVGFASVTLSAGDHLGICEGQCFEMRNPSSSNCELYFFSAKTASAYRRVH